MPTLVDARRWGAAVLLIGLGILAHMHPLVTLVGILIGVPYFGLLGLLVGPLAYRISSICW